jgi:hypothetical protein
MIAYQPIFIRGTANRGTNQMVNASQEQKNTRKVTDNVFEGLSTKPVNATDSSEISLMNRMAWEHERTIRERTLAGDGAHASG